MKKILIGACLAASTFACTTGPERQHEQATNSPVNPAMAASATPVDSSNFTRISWEQTTVDYGTIKEGSNLDVAFNFTNTGDKPLIIESVHPACGCTAAEPPKEPILPGKTGVIRATFNSNGRLGINNKSIVVKANTLGSMAHELHFRVEVEKP
ncbi:MAG: DUF1573 domain-containing protein [Flavihumibacter sp.]